MWFERILEYAVTNIRSNFRDSTYYFFGLFKSSDYSVVGVFLVFMKVIEAHHKENAQRSAD